MLGKKFDIAKAVVWTAMDTLTKQDYVNVVCFSPSCSHSMLGKKFDIAKAVVWTTMDTLTKQDYVNVVCFSLLHVVILCLARSLTLLKLLLGLSWTH